MTPLEREASKMFNFDISYHFELLFSFPENEWFLPSNFEAPHYKYDVCRDFEEKSLIAKKIMPVFKNGSFLGNKIYFLYNKELQYNGQVPN